MADFDVYEVRVEGVCSNGERWNNVLHFRLDSDATDDLFANSEVLAEHVQSEYIADFMARFAADHFYTSTRANRVWPTAGIPAVATVASALAGGVVGESLPPDVALVCTKRTGSPGKSYVGRTFFSGIPEAHQEHDQLIVDQQAYWSQAIHEFFLAHVYTDSEGNQWSPVVFSKKIAAAGGTASTVMAPILRVEFDVTMRNQRGRGRRNRNPITGAPGA